MKSKTTLEDKFKYMKDKLEENVNIYLDDVQRIFPDMKKNTMYWTLSKLVAEGYLMRVRNGVYSFNEYKGKSAAFLSKTAQEVSNILDETGFDYYVSGLDIIQKFLHHIPEEYPVMIFIEKTALEEVEKLLRAKNYSVVEQAKINEIYEREYQILGKSIIVLNATTSFEYDENGLATTEKAFLDLFYAITRNQYPFALQELVRTYINMVRLGVIDQKKLVKISYVRNMQYDIRYIVESKYITEEAIEFVELMKREV